MMRQIVDIDAEEMNCSDCGRVFVIREDNGVIQESNNGKVYVCSECLRNCAGGGC